MLEQCRKSTEAWECNECVAQIVDAARMLSTGHSEKVTVATAEACITIESIGNARNGLSNKL